MATNPIGANNAILQSCVTKDVRSDLGKLAYMRDTTVSKFIAELVKREVAAARLKGIVTDAAQTTLKFGACLLIGLGIGAVSWAALVGQSGPRRIRRRDENVTAICREA